MTRTATTTSTATLTTPLRATAPGGRDGAVSLPRGAQVVVELGGDTWTVTYQGRDYTAPRAAVWAATAPAAEVEREGDATFVWVGGELVGSVLARWSPSDRGAYISGWVVRDERAGVSHGVRQFQRQAEATLAYHLGVVIPW